MLFHSRPKTRMRSLLLIFFTCIPAVFQRCSSTLTVLALFFLAKLKRKLFADIVTKKVLLSFHFHTDTLLGSVTCGLNNKPALARLIVLEGLSPNSS